MSLETTETHARADQPRLLPALLEDRIVKWIGRSGGVVLLVVLALLWLCLLTWSVTDPSLTFATAGRAQNALGAFGAIVSDLLLQMLGFAAVIALLTPMFWSLDLISNERVSGFRVKGSFYPLSVLILAGGLSSLPVPASWPLHHGLGGILGDVLFNMASSVFGLINPERAGIAAGLVLLASGLSALGYSIGVEAKDFAALFERPARPIADEDEAEDNPISSWWKRLWGKRMKKSEEAEAVEAYAGDTEPQFDHGPQFASQRTGEWQQSAPQGGYYVQQAPVHFAPPPGYDPAQGYVVYAQAAPGYPPQPAAPYPHQMPQYGPVQGPPAPYPQATQPQPPYPYAQGAVPNYAPRTAEAPVREHGFDTATEWASRDIAERFAPGAVPLPKSEPAEPGSKAKKPGSSLLGGLGFRRTAEPQYKKPTINMLKRPATAKQGPEFTQTVLRGNARLLEDVLADFGVKGEVRDIKPGPVVTLFELEPARGTKSSRVIGLAEDIARSMSVDERPRGRRARPQRHRHRVAERAARDRAAA